MVLRRSGWVDAVDEERARARAYAYHLPEFCLAHLLLEEHEVQHFGDVYNRVEHVDVHKLSYDGIL